MRLGRGQNYRCGFEISEESQEELSELGSEEAVNGKRRRISVKRNMSGMGRGHYPSTGERKGHEAMGLQAK